MQWLLVDWRARVGKVVGELPWVQVQLCLTKVLKLLLSACGLVYVVKVHWRLPLEIVLVIQCRVPTQSPSETRREEMYRVQCQ